MQSVAAKLQRTHRPMIPQMTSGKRRCPWGERNRTLRSFSLNAIDRHGPRDRPADPGQKTDGALRVHCKSVDVKTTSR